MAAPLSSRGPLGIPTQAILAGERDSGAADEENVITTSHRQRPGVVVTTYAVTFGGRRRLVWTTAEELEELRPVADTEEHRMRSLAGRARTVAGPSPNGPPPRLIDGPENLRAEGRHQLPLATPAPPGDG
jgi:hypothetical protein